jgi:type VI secretion system secreted protein Hcp
VLVKALCENQTIEATFEFFRPNPAGDGTTELFYTINIKQARITKYEMLSPNVLEPGNAAEPPTEVVQFVFHTIDWTWNPTGAAHTDTWDQNA